MSADNLTRLLCNTDGRLRAAADCDEIRRIGIEHVEAISADLAEHVFIRLSGEPDLDNGQKNYVVLHTLDGLLRSIRGSLDTNGVSDEDLRAAHTRAAEWGFLERLEHLFAVSEKGGRA